jgi:hypothetical protein
MSACGGQAPGEAPAEVSWRVAREPSLVIGQPSGDFAGDLDGIVDVARLSDGAIAVADGAERILVFASDGSHLRTIGRRGQGPGEFRGGPSLQILDGDSILAYDGWARRASLFDRDGALVETLAFPRCCTLLGRAQDGTLVFAEQVLTGITPGRTNPGIERSGWVLLHLDTRGEVLDTIASVPGIEMLITGVERVPPVVGTFLRDPHFAFGGDEAFVATGDRFEVTAFGTSEPHAARTSRPPSSPPPRPIERADVDLWLRGTDDSGIDESGIDAVLAALPSDQTLPATRRVLRDDVGWVWVEHYAPAGAPPLAFNRVVASSRWSAFDLDGEAVFDVEMPPRFVPYQIGQDFVLGVARDSLDVQWVHMYALEREQIAPERTP